MEALVRKRFPNPHLENDRRHPLDFIRWRLGMFDDPHPLFPLPKTFSYPGLPKRWDAKKPSALWIGHSTYLIQSDSSAFLTDPVWSNYCSPVPIPVLKRKNPPPIPIPALPRLSAVLISHNHYDHLDLPSVRQIQKHIRPPLWIVAEGIKPWFDRKKIGPCVELSWWKSLDLADCTITAVPAQHFSGRTLWDHNQTHWNGYVITLKSDGRKIYFCGDTGYNPADFKAIGKRFGHMDLSLLPIGAYIPRKFMSPVHCSPSDAVAIHQDVNSKLSLGMHWATFTLSEEPLERPPFDLYLAMKEKNLDFDAFLPIRPGERVNW